MFTRPLSQVFVFLGVAIFGSACEFANRLPIHPSSSQETYQAGDAFSEEYADFRTQYLCPSRENVVPFPERLIDRDREFKVCVDREDDARIAIEFGTAIDAPMVCIFPFQYNQTTRVITGLRDDRTRQVLSACVQATSSSSYANLPQYEYSGVGVEFPTNQFNGVFIVRLEDASRMRTCLDRTQFSQSGCPAFSLGILK